MPLWSLARCQVQTSPGNADDERTRQPDSIHQIDKAQAPPLSWAIRDVLLPYLQYVCTGKSLHVPCGGAFVDFAAMPDGVGRLVSALLAYIGVR